MLSSVLILVISTALFCFYIQVICERILKRTFREQAFQPIVNANRLEFPSVRTALEEFHTPVDYAWVKMALQCDFLALTYLLKNAGNRRRAFTFEERLLMIYFRTLSLSVPALRLLKLREKPAILKQTEILFHFANLVGERVNHIGDDATSSDYLLTL